ncbi:hypothetical protein [Sphingomonas sp. LB2R24]|uniref:hypothetical protein n=1 Tax=Sphingomonas sorbitolis TaxID=3096165 RepID=UPI002FCA3E06
MSIAEPAMAHNGIKAAAMIASVLPRMSRRRRPRTVFAFATLLRIVDSHVGF